MTPIRSLDIRRGERWTPGYVAIHMALATAPATTLPKRKRRWRLWHYLALSWLSPSIMALSVIAALALLRRGLL